MPRVRKISRIVIIDEQYKVTQDTITAALDKLVEPTGIVVSDTSVIDTKSTTQLLHNKGYLNASESNHSNKAVLRKNSLEQVAYFLKHYEVVFLIYPHNQVDVCYQDAVHLSDDVVTFH